MHAALGVTAPDTRDDFLSGTSGRVLGMRSTARAIVTDAVCDAAYTKATDPQRTLAIHRDCR